MPEVDTEKEIVDRIKKSLKPVDDGFYQLGYREAISDVVYITSVSIMLFLLTRSLVKMLHEPN